MELMRRYRAAQKGITLHVSNTVPDYVAGVQYYSEGTHTLVLNLCTSSLSADNSKSVLTLTFLVPLLMSNAEA